MINEIKMRLATEMVISKTVYDPVSLEEFIKIFIDVSPVRVWCKAWSADKPILHITRLIMPSEGGVYGYFDVYADHTPKLIPWENLYYTMKISGLHEFEF